MADDFDLFANINDLDDLLAKKPLHYDSPQTPESPSMLDLTNSPPRRSTPAKSNLSNSSVNEMSKKGQQLMKRYEKKQEVVQKKAEKKKATEMRREILMNQSSSSMIPRRRNTPSSSFRYRRSWRRRSSPELDMDEMEGIEDYECDDYINIGSPPDPISTSSGNASGSHSVSVSSVDLSSEIDYEVTIKLKWKDAIERIPYWHNQTFQDLFKMLSEREGAEQDRVFLLMNNSRVYPTDSPSSIGYTCVDFISGRVMDSELMATKKSKKLKTGIKLKVQSDRWKRPLVLTAEKRDTVQELVKKCAEELKCSTDDISLRFDGDILGQALTVQDLELEGGEILDCVFKKGA